MYSEPGLGTTVRIYFPAVDLAASPAGGSRDQRYAQGQGETVLVVDDDDAIREVARRVLARNGYRVLDAANGQKALDLAGDRTCDLLLTDVVMPEMSGRELAERLRSRHPDLAVLFMSGYSEDVLGRRTLHSERTLHSDTKLIQKPFNQRDLLATVRAVITLAAGPTAPTGSPRSADSGKGGGGESGR